MKDQYVLIGTERQGSINFCCAAPSGEYKKIFSPFSHPELKADTSAAVSLHYFGGEKNKRITNEQLHTDQDGVAGLFSNSCRSPQ